MECEGNVSAFLRLLGEFPLLCVCMSVRAFVSLFVRAFVRVLSSTVRAPGFLLV